jgi:hypothetical protein
MIQIIFNQEIKSFDFLNLFNYVKLNYSVSTLNTIKEYLKMCKKLEKCKSDIFFLTSCLQYNKLPNFTYFKTTNKKLRFQPIYNNCRKLLTTAELSNHKQDLYKYNRIIKQFNNDKLFEINSADLNSIKYVFDNRALNKFRYDTKKRCINKLNKIGIDLSLNDAVVDPHFNTTC